MDCAEWRAAYRRATMDEQIAKDCVDDMIEVLEERVRLHNQIHKLENQIRQLEAERDQWQRLANQ